jgi:RNA polymerase sigma factor (sigma-70 family)
MRTQQEKDDFLQLISKNEGIIIKICNSYCDNKTDREDLAQEIIYTLWKGGKTFNPDYKFSTWMYRVALNVAISYYRAAKKFNNHVLFTEADLELEDKVLPDTFTHENYTLLRRKNLQTNS